MLARCGLEDLAQIRVHRDGELGAGLALLQVQNAVADMLAAHADDIAAALAGIERECESESRLAADRMVKLKLRDLLFGPGVKAAALPALEFHADARVGLDLTFLDAPVHQAANRLE